MLTPRSPTIIMYILHYFFLSLKNKTVEMQFLFRTVVYLEPQSMLKVVHLEQLSIDYREYTV